MTEDEAKKKWCPMVRDGIEPMGNTAGDENRIPDWSLCIASDCMMWRWSEGNGERGIGNEQGCCGLTEKP